MTIIDPENHREYFDELKTKLFESPLTIAELTCLRSLVEDQLKAEWDQFHLFTIGDRQRENVRNQFYVLGQALELDRISYARPQPERHNGVIKWNIYNRRTDVYAVLVLSGTDDTWSIEPIVYSKRKLGIMTPKEKQDTLAFNGYSLKNLLINQGVDLEGLGGWKVAC